MQTIPIHLAELRRCGPGALALPAAGALGGAAVAALGAGPVPALSRSGAGLLFSLVVAMAVIAALGRESMVELHLSAPTPFPVTVGRRLTGILLVGAASGAGLVTWLAVSGAVSGAGDAIVAAAGLTGPSLLLSGVAAWAWSRRGSTAVASGAVLAAAVAHALWWETTVPLWWLNRAATAAAGVALVVAALAALRDEERVLLGGRR